MKSENVLISRKIYWIFLTNNVILFIKGNSTCQKKCSGCLYLKDRLFERKERTGMRKTYKAEYEAYEDEKR